MSELRQDLARSGYPSLPRAVAAASYRPEVRVVILYRLQAWFADRGLRPLAQLMVNLNQLLTGAEFVLGCQIGGGLVVKHPNGIVIGKGAVIGRDCTLLHQVTVGERYLASAGGGVYPTIGDRVTLGAKSSILGDLHLGDDVTVGAHALVLADVPSGVTVRGVHASSAGDG